MNHTTIVLRETLAVSNRSFLHQLDSSRQLRLRRTTAGNFKFQSNRPSNLTEWPSAIPLRKCPPLFDEEELFGDGSELLQSGEREQQIGVNAT